MTTATAKKYERGKVTEEERHQELSTELTEKREVLNGPTFERNVPGAIEQLQALR